ncbi:unnamed protein product [Allacma fusca]|uniref:Uncharacterized protein n=1 Tax=Allacma fusca TaxID=39272 RepID=A0A8J2K1J3_9HEXA|nr:unnamed protein product [Allacma fusca]
MKTGAGEPWPNISKYFKQPACDGGGEDDYGPGGNPLSGEKERFYLPKFFKIVTANATSVDRPSKKIGAKFCRNMKCQASTVHQYPNVPEGWSRCQRCSLSYLHDCELKQE